MAFFIILIVLCGQEYDYYDYLEVVKVQFCFVENIAYFSDFM